MPIYDLLTHSPFSYEQIGRLAYIAVSLAFIFWLYSNLRNGTRRKPAQSSRGKPVPVGLGVDQITKRPFSERGNPLSSPIKATFPFRRKLLVDDELVLYQVVVEAATKLNLLVHPQVSLSSVFEGLLEAEVASSGIKGASAITFLLTDRRDLKVVAGVQVEPKRQLSAEAQSISDKRAALFRAAKLPLIRLYNLTSYTEDEMRARFEDALGVQPLQ